MNIVLHYLFFRLERQLSRAEKRTSKMPKLEILTDQTSVPIPRILTAPSPASSSTVTSADLNELTSQRPASSSTVTSADLNELASQRLTSGSDLTDDIGLGSNLAGNLKNICYAKSPVLLSSPASAAPSPSNSDTNTVSQNFHQKI